MRLGMGVSPTIKQYLQRRTKPATTATGMMNTSGFDSSSLFWEREREKGE